MPISRYIAIAVGQVLLGLRPVADSAVELSEAEVAVGEQRPKATGISDGERVTIVRGRCGIESAGIASDSDVAQHTQCARLVWSLAVLSACAQGVTRTDERLLDPVQEASASPISTATWRNGGFPGSSCDIASPSKDNPASARPAHVCAHPSRAVSPGTCMVMFHSRARLWPRAKTSAARWNSPLRLRTRPT